LEEVESILATTIGQVYLRMRTVPVSKTFGSGGRPGVALEEELP